MSHLEYALLDGNQEFPVIISSMLSHQEKDLVLQVLSKHKGALAWKVVEIKGISPSFCMHKILMEDNFKPVVQHQYRLNPKVQDGVKAEIVKLLDAGLIYAISDGDWISPIHVVPKKRGMNVITNEKRDIESKNAMSKYIIFQRILKARVGRNVDGMNLNLYEQSLNS
nr:putative reverse transcriptase domain-containing protein [Tanacetum cinerariifolium]